jgi:hypothetical protein
MSGTREEQYAASRENIGLNYERKPSIGFNDIQPIILPSSPRNGLLGSNESKWPYKALRLLVPAHSMRLLRPS